MEATHLSDRLIEELHGLSRAEKLRFLQILVDELAAESAVNETLAPYGNAAAVEALSDLLETDESAERNTE